MPETWTVPIAQRALLAMTRIQMRLEERGTITDSDILDVCDAWTTGACGEKADFYCTAEDCCDYQRLSGMVWEWVEATYA